MTRKLLLHCLFGYCSSFRRRARWHAAVRQFLCVPGGSEPRVSLLPLPRSKSNNGYHFLTCACHPCAGAMLIFSVSFQFLTDDPRKEPKTHLCMFQICVLRLERAAFKQIASLVF